MVGACFGLVLFGLLVCFGFMEFVLLFFSLIWLFQITVKLLCFTECGHFHYLLGKLMYVTHHQCSKLCIGTCIYISGEAELSESTGGLFGFFLYSE